MGTKYWLLLIKSISIKTNLCVLCCPVNVPHTRGGFLSVGPRIVKESRRSHLPAPVIGGLSLPPSSASAGWGPLPGESKTEKRKGSVFNYNFYQSIDIKPYKHNVFDY